MICPCKLAPLSGTPAVRRSRDEKKIGTVGIGPKETEYETFAVSSISSSSLAQPPT
jgi:hypothetical protein